MTLHSLRDSFVYVIERFQDVYMLDFAGLRTYGDVVKVYDTKKQADVFVKKHDHDLIKEEDQISELTYDRCTWKYEVTKVRLSN